MRRQVSGGGLWALVALLLAGLAPARAADAGLDFFEKRIRPVLVEHCYKCHSVEAGKQRGGLALDTREGLLTGGDSGPALNPARPEESLILRAVRYTEEELRMPPKGRLPATVVADLEKWVAQGAPAPRETARPDFGDT